MECEEAVVEEVGEAPEPYYTAIIGEGEGSLIGNTGPLEPTMFNGQGDLNIESCERQVTAKFESGYDLLFSKYLYKAEGRVGHESCERTVNSGLLEMGIPLGLNLSTGIVIPIFISGMINEIVSLQKAPMYRSRSRTVARVGRSMLLANKMLQSLFVLGEDQAEEEAATEEQ